MPTLIDQLVVDFSQQIRNHIDYKLSTGYTYLDIANDMDYFNVSPVRVAEAYGLTEEDVLSVYMDVKPYGLFSVTNMIDNTTNSDPMLVTPPPVVLSPPPPVVLSPPPPPPVESNPVDPQVVKNNPFFVGSFQPNSANHYRTAGIDFHVRDVDGDGVDEVFVSNVSFDWEANPWYNSYAQIFGFNQGELGNETKMWMRGDGLEYTGGFRINFGDFNGDGRTDVFLTSFTDTPNHQGASVMLINTGVKIFDRIEIENSQASVSHDTVVADFNGDGLDDILYTGSVMILGSKTSDFRVLHTPPNHISGSAIGSGLSAADFMHDDSITIVMTDGPGNGDPESDTILFHPRIEDDHVFMDKIGVLPTDRFFLPKWQTVRDAVAVSPHAVRNLAVDFDRDGKTDVLVFSTMPKNNNAHGHTEVQFLKNLGQGEFTDVTDQILINFDTNKTVTYNPQLIDINRDGLVDIFMPATDYSGSASNSILISLPDGRYAETGLAFFRDFETAIRQHTGPFHGSMQSMAWLQGPDQSRYLITGIDRDSNIGAWIDVYAQEFQDSDMLALYQEIIPLIPNITLSSLMIM